MDLDAKRIVLLYEGMKITSRVGKVVIINNNRVLLLQKNGNLKWELPGGHIHSDEKLLKGTCREVKEETGIVLNKQLLDVIDTTKHQGCKTRWYKYTAPVKQKIKMSNEHVNYKWVSKAKLDKYDLSNSTNHLAILSTYG